MNNVRIVTDVNNIKRSRTIGLLVMNSPRQQYVNIGLLSNDRHASIATIALLALTPSATLAPAALSIDVKNVQIKTKNVKKRKKRDKNKKRL